MFMLDTNIIIFALRHPKSGCARRIMNHLGKDICISVITYAELEFGIRNSSNPDNNRSAIQRILAGIPILDFDQDAAIHFGDILADLRRRHIDGGNQDRDKMIAAHARSLGYTIVTNNVKDFEMIRRLRITDWRTPGDLNAF